MTVGDGVVRRRQWAFSAAQSAHGTASTPSRALGWRGTPTIEPNWTDQTDVDTGSIDPTLPAYRTQTDITATLAGPLTYNDWPLLMAATIRGGVTATGGPIYTWAHQSLSTTTTTPDEFSAQWGDDVTQDGMRFRDGLVEDLEVSFDESLGPWQVSSTWRFGYVNPHVTPVAGLTVGSNLSLVFGADTALYIDATSGGIGGTLISNALHSMSIKVTPTIDQKRFANGSNTRFAVAGYGYAGRDIEFTFTFAKDPAIIAAGTSESVNWLAGSQVVRYFKVNAISPDVVSGSTPYSLDLRFSGTWRTRTDGELGGNTTVTLMGKGRLDDGLGYALRSSVVNSRPSLP